jgi:hypothetical protein
MKKEDLENFSIEEEIKAQEIQDLEELEEKLNTYDPEKGFSSFANELKAETESNREGRENEEEESEEESHEAKENATESTLDDKALKFKSEMQVSMYDFLNTLLCQAVSGEFTEETEQKFSISEKKIKKFEEAFYNYNKLTGAKPSPKADLIELLVLHSAKNSYQAFLHRKEKRKNAEKQEVKEEKSLLKIPLKFSENSTQNFEKKNENFDNNFIEEKKELVIDESNIENLDIETLKKIQEQIKEKFKKEGLNITGTKKNQFSVKKNKI